MSVRGIDSLTPPPQHTPLGAPGTNTEGHKIAPWYTCTVHQCQGDTRGQRSCLDSEYLLATFQLVVINLVGDESQKLTPAHNRTRKSKGLVIPCRSWEFLGNFAFWPLVTPDDNFENSWGNFAFWPLSTPDGRSLTSGDLIRSLVFTKNNKVLMVFTSHLRGFRSFTFGDLWPSSTRKKWDSSS